MGIIDNSFRRVPRYYVVQSLFAVLAFAIILYFVKVLTHAAIVGALGSSAFIVFAMPHSLTARTRRLIGGHIVGIGAGAICYFAFLVGPLGRLVTRWEFTTLLVYALAVGLSIFLMTATNTEHPPAAGTALGIVAHEWSFQVIIFILLAATCLAVARRLLRGRLKDLF